MKQLQKLPDLSMHMLLISIGVLLVLVTSMNYRLNLNISRGLSEIGDINDSSEQVVSEGVESTLAASLIDAVSTSLLIDGDKEEIPEGFTRVGAVELDLCPSNSDGVCGFGSEVYISTSADSYYLIQRSAACDIGPCVERFGPYSGDTSSIKGELETLNQYAELVRR